MITIESKLWPDNEQTNNDEPQITEENTHLLQMMDGWADFLSEVQSD